MQVRCEYIEQQLQTADDACSSSCMLGEVVTTFHRKMSSCYEILHMVLGLYILWNDLMHKKGT
jgi:hypothetical protein